MQYGCIAATGTRAYFGCREWAIVTLVMFDEVRLFLDGKEDRLLSRLERRLLLEAEEPRFLVRFFFLLFFFLFLAPCLVERFDDLLDDLCFLLFFFDLAEYRLERPLRLLFEPDEELRRLLVEADLREEVLEDLRFLVFLRFLSDRLSFFCGPAETLRLETLEDKRVFFLLAPSVELLRCPSVDVREESQSSIVFLVASLVDEGCRWLTLFRKIRESLRFDELFSLLGGKYLVFSLNLAEYLPELSVSLRVSSERNELVYLEIFDDGSAEDQRLSVSLLVIDGSRFLVSVFKPVGILNLVELFVDLNNVL